MKIVSVSQMKQIEKEADLHGLSYEQMMENAGYGSFLKINEILKFKKVIIFCGNGNNGGDGFVVARLFSEANINCEVVLPCGLPKTDIARKNFTRLEKTNVKIHENANKIIKTADTIIVDAIYGTGFHGLFDKNMAEIADFINSSKLTVVSLDIPSGINADSATGDKNAVKAKYTLTFDCMKNAHIDEKSKIYCGKVLVIDIKIPKCVHEKVLNKEI